MIDVKPPVLIYAAHRPPFHDGMHEEHASATFRCTSCGSTVERNVLSAISSGMKWFRSLPLADQQTVTKAFLCTLEFVGPSAIAYPHFPNGDAAYICTAECERCQSCYLLAIQFYEKQPARYVAVLQGVAGLSPNHSFQPPPRSGAA